MKVRLITVLILSFCLNKLIAQKPVDINSALDKRNFSVFHSASAFLKNNKNPIINFKDSTALNKFGTVYDSLIKTFFDLSYLKDSMKDEKNPFQARLSLQKAILYNIDYFLDILPADSVWFSPLEGTELRSDSNSYPPNTLVAYYPLAGQPFYTTVIIFNKEGKIFGVSPIIHFQERKNPGDIEQFLLRHNHHEIRDKLWRP